MDTKKLILVTLMALFAALAPLLGPSAALAGHPAGTHVYAQIRGKTPVNLRSRPNGQIVGSLKKGEKILIDPHASRGGWTRVINDGKGAWIFTNYVITENTPDREIGDTGIATVDSDAPMRMAPDAGAKKIDMIPENVELKVTGRAQGNWYPVRWNGKRGFVHKNHLSGDTITDSAACETCRAGGASSAWARLKEAAGAAVDKAKELAGNARDLLAKWFRNAWNSAVKGRHVARFLGGGYRSGNRPKGMCAQAVKEALVDSGLCHGSLPGNAIDLHTKGVLKKRCPRLKYMPHLRDPKSAPSGAVIVYSGYAGHTRHSFGHIESKIMKDGVANYCSDFCRPRPTQTSHNPVAAIYVLE